ncbi:cation transporter [Psychromonas marina]|uniref:Cation transporter n=1 Tax=Psychromonas marina TaxID=88364 RepID=A0ABQ6DXP7_9GAMM|nr:cation transporter [Psychromonas marina]GLS89860.1 cation transporter [Psychromonas marina]
MAGCCGGHANFDGMSQQYKRILWWVIAINGVMFFIEMSAGIGAQSQALQADALDFLGDTLTYGISLWAIGKSLTLRSNVALFKGYSLLIMALWVFGSTLYRFFIINSPEPFTMGSIALLAFSANVVSVLLLMRYKDGDANVRSVWLCSRNDAIGNLIVLIAASGVWYSNSALPDLIVAFILAALFLSSAWQIINQAKAEKKKAESASRCHSEN